jgi:hypothetical protein
MEDDKCEYKKQLIEEELTKLVKDNEDFIIIMEDNKWLYC